MVSSSETPSPDGIRSDGARGTLKVLYTLGYPQRMAGSQRSLLELVENLPRQVTPLVWLPREGDVAAAFRSAGVEVIVREPGRGLNDYGKSILDWSLARRVWSGGREYLPHLYRMGRLIRSEGVDLIHANDPRATLLVGPAARWARRPLVGHLRGEKAFGGIFWRVYERLPDRFIAVSHPIRSALSPQARRRCVTVYNGTGDLTERGGEVPWLASLRKTGVCVVVCMASVVPFKGLHHLLRAVALLNGRGLRERVVVVCVGKSSRAARQYQDWLWRLQRDLLVDNLLFTGWQDDPFSFYRSSDISVLPSVQEENLRMDETVVRVRGNEGFPRTHLEAMCYGLPIVGTDIAGVGEQIVDGKNGLLVPPSDANALADGLERLISDAGLRRRMGEEGRRKVRAEFSTEAYVDGVMRVYRELLERPV